MVLGLGRQFKDLTSSAGIGVKTGPPPQPVLMRAGSHSAGAGRAGTSDAGVQNASTGYTQAKATNPFKSLAGLVTQAAKPEPDRSIGSISPADAARDTAVMERVVRQGSKQEKMDFAKKLLLEDSVDPSHKVNLLSMLGGSSGMGLIGNSLPLAEIVKNPSPAMQHGLQTLMQDRNAAPKLTEQVAKTGSPEAQAKLAGIIYKMQGEQAPFYLQTLAASAGKQGWNQIVAGANTDNAKQILDKMVRFSDASGMKDLTGLLSSENKTRLAGILVDRSRSEGPNSGVSATLSEALGSLKPSAKNQFIDSLQGTGRWNQFVAMQSEPAALERLLPGLTPQNAAALRQGFARLESKAAGQVEVQNPENIGVRQTSGSSQGTSNTRGRTDSSEVAETFGSNLGLEAGGGPVKVNGGASYSRTATNSSSESIESSRSQERSHGRETDLDARERYGRDVQISKGAERYRDAIAQVDQWAAQQRPSFSEKFRAERAKF